MNIADRNHKPTQYYMKKAAPNWLVSDEAMARRILRASASSLFARRYFSNALCNGYSHEAVSAALSKTTLKQKLAWMGSAYLEGLLLEHGKLGSDAAKELVRAREQRRRDKYKSLVENARKAFSRKAEKTYRQVVKAFNVEGHTYQARVWSLTSDYSYHTYAILWHLGEFDTS